MAVSPIAGRRNVEQPDAGIEYQRIVGRACATADVFYTLIGRPSASPHSGDILVENHSKTSRDER
jgi:hypothetical protein